MKRGKLALLGGAVLAVVALGWYWAGSDAEALRGPVSAAASLASSRVMATGAGAETGAGSHGPLSAAGLQARQDKLALWRGRAERSEQLYASYRDSTRYPPDSHPIAEHPDQVRPFQPIVEENTLRRAYGSGSKGFRLRTSQERVFLSGAESVKFTIEAQDDRGVALPLIVTSASAQSVPDTRTPVRLIQTNVTFSDDGTGADSVAGDGKYTARVSPAQQGFEAYAGTIRLLAQVNVKGEQGVAHFDVIYTPGVPATWAGVREALENGSLNFYLKANVAMPGRYVVSARVDDANGVPFALLQFNDEVAAGVHEFKLTLFGALVRDKGPLFPLRLRDVDGFLLIPDKFPDRFTMARQSGVVYTSARYGVDRFSPDEWTSEERSRYLSEYGKDAETARAEVARLEAQ
jgi:hypothetical protein